jgi:hypothetical protein
MEDLDSQLIDPEIVDGHRNEKDMGLGLLETYSKMR